jgi:hypothetical protein
MKCWKHKRLNVTILSIPCICCLVRAADRSVEFTDIPAFGTDGKLKGHAENIDYADYSVAVYIYASGWWTKPAFDAPLPGRLAGGYFFCCKSGDCIVRIIVLID